MRAEYNFFAGTNRRVQTCIQMDMEKIIIRCNADYLQYEFPKRKWYDLRQFDRIALMRLDFADTDMLDTDIGLELYEKYEGEPAYHVDEEFRAKMYGVMLSKYGRNHENAEHLIVMDNTEDLSGILCRLSENRNYLSVITDNPDLYENAVEYIEENYGLIPMFFSSCKELLRYLKQMPEKKQALLVSGNPNAEKECDAEVKKADKYMAPVICSLPKDSILMDFSDSGIHRELIFRKRMQITYASIPIFLDNIVKNRYNAVVNEGITIQVKKYNKHVWRRKGNEDGRKEKYPDL